MRGVVEGAGGGSRSQVRFGPSSWRCEARVARRCSICIHVFCSTRKLIAALKVHNILNLQVPAMWKLCTTC